MRLAVLLAHGMRLVGTAAVDGALDLEQRIQTPDRLQRDRGDRFALLQASDATDRRREEAG